MSLEIKNAYELKVNMTTSIEEGKSYVYDGQEVLLTGRKAINKTSNRYREVELTIVEITPLDPEITWTKFVKITDLFEIT